MSQASPPLIPAVYINRRTGLVGFGIFAIVLGLLACLGLVTLLFVPRPPRPADNAWVGYFPFILFLVIAGTLLTLGTGSIRARRWARALILCVSGCAMVCGLLGVTMATWALMGMHAGVLRPAQASAPNPAMMAVALGVAALCYLAIPGLFLWFYRRPGVKETCEALDPQPRWTDRCPVPVLAGSLLIGGGHLMMIFAVISGSGFPLAGMMVTGIPARIMTCGDVLFGLYAARGLYLLDLRVWKLAMIVYSVLMVSAILTFARVDPHELLAHSGQNAEQLEAISHSPFAHGHTLLWLSVGASLLNLGYLAYLRRYFPKQMA